LNYLQQNYSEAPAVYKESTTEIVNYNINLLLNINIGSKNIMNSAIRLINHNVAPVSLLSLKDDSGSAGTAVLGSILRKYAFSTSRLANKTGKIQTGAKRGQLAATTTNTPLIIARADSNMPLQANIETTVLLSDKASNAPKAGNRINFEAGNKTNLTEVSNKTEFINYLTIRRNENNQMLVGSDGKLPDEPDQETEGKKRKPVQPRRRYPEASENRVLTEYKEANALLASDSYSGTDNVDISVDNAEAT